MKQFRRAFESYLVILAVGRGRLRAAALSLRGARVGVKASIGMRCRVDRPWCVSLGDRFVAEDDVYFKVVADDAALELGDHVFIGRGSEFDVAQRVSVGSHTVIAPGCFITDHNHGISGELRIDEQPCVAQPVSIGRDVWLGTNVVVVAGVNIGDGAVVGASAVVTRNVPAMAVVAGVPAKVLRYRNK